MSRDPSGECTPSDYDGAVSWCRRTISSRHEMLSSPHAFHAEIRSASRRYGLSYEGMHSLFRTVHVTHMKRSSGGVRSRTMRHVRSYLNGASILEVARRENYPPAMMARLIVENVAALWRRGGDARNESGGGRGGRGNGGGGRGGGALSKADKKLVTEAIRYPEKILGRTSSLLPEYAFSEKNGTGRQRQDRDCEGMPLSRLAVEVRQALDSDPMYGPRSDRERHNVGVEYEVLLEETLRDMGVPFETEDDLRRRGAAKTPDVLLLTPLGIKVRKCRRREKVAIEDDTVARLEDRFAEATAVGDGGTGIGEEPVEQDKEYGEDEDDYEWKMICWIDSKVRKRERKVIQQIQLCTSHKRHLFGLTAQLKKKALFGDVETHTDSVLPQAEGYVHRFGPGLVLYWFGHAPSDRLDDGFGDVTVLGGDLPESFLLPTGEVVGRGGRVLHFED